MHRTIFETVNQHCDKQNKKQPILEFLKRADVAVTVDKLFAYLTSYGTLIIPLDDKNYELVCVSSKNEDTILLSIEDKSKLRPACTIYLEPTGSHTVAIYDDTVDILTILKNQAFSTLARGAASRLTTSPPPP